MGNRAVITACKDNDPQFSYDIGVYLHWCGGRDSVEALLAYCEAKGYREPDTDNYGWARLCQVIGNTLGGTLSVGIDCCRRLDCDNCDNGTYIISGWAIVDRKFFDCVEQGSDGNVSDLYELLLDINAHQPEAERLDDETLQRVAAKRWHEWHDKEAAE